MLGSMVAGYLSRQPGLAITATVRNKALREHMSAKYSGVSWRVADFASGAPSAILDDQRRRNPFPDMTEDALPTVAVDTGIIESTLR